MRSDLFFIPINSIVYSVLPSILLIFIIIWAHPRLPEGLNSIDVWYYLIAANRAVSCDCTVRDIFYILSLMLLQIIRSLFIISRINCLFHFLSIIDSVLNFKRQRKFFMLLNYRLTTIIKNSIRLKTFQLITEKETTPWLRELSSVFFEIHSFSRVYQYSFSS